MQNKSVDDIVFEPCKECINALRNKLFDLKTNFGMLSYAEARDFLSNIGICRGKDKITRDYGIYVSDISENIFDIYGESSFSNKNVEHVVPASVMIPAWMRHYSGECNMEFRSNINGEPYHDLHNLSFVNKSINDARFSFEFGEEFSSRELAIEKKSIIINDGKLYIPEGSNYRNMSNLYKINLVELKKLPEENDIYISGDEYTCNNASDNCIFQPPRSKMGEISRIIFYYYLMYGYDPTTRPSTENTNRINPWIYNYDPRSHPDQQVTGVNFYYFEQFFFKHIKNFYNWSKSYPGSENEDIKNDILIEMTGIPNIFIGFRTHSGKYIQTDHDVVDDLFFGKIHDHNLYKKISLRSKGISRRPYCSNNNLKDNLLREKIRRINECYMENNGLYFGKTIKEIVDKATENMETKKSVCRFNIGKKINIISPNTSNSRDEENNEKLWNEKNHHHQRPRTSHNNKTFSCRNDVPPLRSDVTSSWRNDDPLSIENNPQKTAKYVPPHMRKSQSPQILSIKENKKKDKPQKGQYGSKIGGNFESLYLENKNNYLKLKT
jgi:endonuclease I